jgi:hypothetical protein
VQNPFHAETTVLAQRSAYQQVKPQRASPSYNQYGKGAQRQQTLTQPQWYQSQSNQLKRQERKLSCLDRHESLNEII